MENKLIISPSPHVHSGDSISKNMYAVLVALIPAYAVSLIQFGLGAAVVMLISVLVCILVEYLITRFMLNRPATIADGSAILTGVLLAMNLPSNLPWWIVVIGAVMAIGLGKMVFGGLGGNIFNPALVGRVFLLISFPAQMTMWPAPQQLALIWMLPRELRRSADERYYPRCAGCKLGSNAFGFEYVPGGSWRFSG